MSRQIAVRLPDDLVAFIDQLIGQGKASSRASVVAAAVERERRRHIAARDAKILAGVDQDSDFDSLARYAVNAPLDLD